MIFDWLLIISLAVMVIIIGRKIPSVLSQMQEIPRVEHRDEKSSEGTLRMSAAAMGVRALQLLGQLGLQIRRVFRAAYALIVRRKGSVERLTAKQPKPFEAVRPQHKLSPGQEITLGDAEAAFTNKRYRDAERLFLRLCAVHPHDARLYAKLGSVYMELKSFSDARDAFAQAIKLDPTIAARHVNYGIALLQLNRSHEALQAFEKALALQPDNKRYQALQELARSRT